MPTDAFYNVLYLRGNLEANKIKIVNELQLTMAQNFHKT